MEAAEMASWLLTSQKLKVKHPQDGASISAETIFGDFSISRFIQPCNAFGVAILVMGVYFCLPSGLGVRNLFS